MEDLQKTETKPPKVENHYIQKGLKEYFLEGMMIFLAVMLGFISENVREDLIDEATGKQYAVSFREDLCKDTALIHTHLVIFERNINSAASVIRLISQNRIRKKEDIKKLYEYNIPAMGGFSLNLTDRTSTQLKNGGMRLITRKKVVEGIIVYWNNMALINRLEEALQQMRWEARELSYGIFDQKYYAENAINGKRAVAEEVTLMTTDKTQLTVFQTGYPILKTQ